MRKKYVTMDAHIINCDVSNVLTNSGFVPDTKPDTGCSCGCCDNPDGSNTGGGCWGCPDCNHDNQGNHNCNEY